MTQVHLSDKRLQALYDGEPGTHWEREHLVSCSVCQEAFDDTLWMGLLIRLQKAERIEGPHPDRDELLAYRTRALPEARREQIRRHLSGCRSCMAACSREQAELRRRGYTSPSRKTLRNVMGQFRPRKMHRLGRLMIARLGKRFALQFLPYAGPLLGVSDFGLHPASARRRALRLGVDAECISGGSPLEPETDEAHIEDDRWDVRVFALRGKAHDRLRVTLAPSDDDGSAAEVQVRVVPEQGDESSANTDANGVAVLDCPRGRSRLIVEVDPPLAVDVQFDD